MIIRAIPQWAGAPEQFYDISNMPWKVQKDIREELGLQGFYVQDIHPIDSMPLQVSAELRRRNGEDTDATL